MRYLEVPKKVIQSLGGKLSIRLICTINQKITFQCGLVALGEGKGYITLTKKRMKELGVTEGSKIKVVLKQDASKFGMPMPKELEAVLEQDDEGRLRFEKLTPGKQRYILHYVGTAKDSEIRIERALLLIGNLKTLPFGKESFREMLGKGPRPEE